MSQGQQVRRAPAPEPRQALTFRTDERTMRRVRDLAGRLGVSTNDALNIIVKIQLADEAAREVSRRSREPGAAARVDAILASLGAHETGEDGS